jgi:arylsulfatase A-like enzyme
MARGTTHVYGSKRTTLEGGIHLPFVVQSKARFPAGTVYDRPVMQLDISPTALTAAGVAIQLGWGVDGVDLLPFLTRQYAAPPHETLVGRQGCMMAICLGDGMLVRYDWAVEIPGASPSLSNPDPSPFRR